MKGDVKEIYKVYDGKHRELVIPVYQRNYDWTITQCARLFDDLEALYSERRPKPSSGQSSGMPKAPSVGSSLMGSSV